MDIPRFIQSPPSDTEMETARLLAEGYNVKQIAAKRHLARETIQAHTRSLRAKFHVTNMQGLMAQLYLFRFLKLTDLIDKLPATWLKYLKK
jgi:DNA-binding CsgD family transcriptional regulator